jgi:hypothetical protein
MRICSLHDVDAGDQLGHRMLDLDAGVHLDEVELAVLVEELEGAGAAIADLAAGLGAALADACPRPGCGDARRGRFLEDLLVATLHRAVALAQDARRCRARRPSTWISMWRGFSRNFSM